MCIIEAALGEPPFAFLDDGSVRGILEEGGIPGQPEQMSNDVWELMVLMINQDPAKRITLPHVLERPKELADAEEAAEKLSAAETHCSACTSVIVGDSAFCDRCGGKVASEYDGLPTLDRTACVAALMDIITTAGAADTERALLLLARKCTDSQERLQMYEANGVQVLSDVVRTGDNYVAQLYALECLNWAARYSSEVPTSRLALLQDCIRDVTTPELTSLLNILLHGNDQEKDDGLVLCASVAYRRNHDALLEVGIVPPSVGFFSSGSGVQKLWAAEALEKFAGNNDASRVAITRDGGISLLMELVSTGTNEQKQWAVYALGKLANNESSRVTIARDGGILPLVALVRAETDQHKEEAAYVLGKLACNDANRVTIARDGGISPLVALARVGTDQQKLFAAYALGKLAENEANRVAIARDGGIPALRAMVRMGTGEQKRSAEHALRKLMQPSLDWWRLRSLGPRKWQRKVLPYPA